MKRGFRLLSAMLEGMMGAKRERKVNRIGVGVAQPGPE